MAPPAFRVQCRDGRARRLSAHQVKALALSNEVRLWLSVIAYNLANLWRRLALAKRNRRQAADKSTAAAGENRRALAKARPSPLAAASGKPPTRPLSAGMPQRIATLPVPAE
jgi:hypothetical protein